MFLLCSGEFLGGLLELLNLVKMLNALHNLTLSKVTVTSLNIASEYCCDG